MHTCTSHALAACWSCGSIAGSPGGDSCPDLSSRSDCFACVEHVLSSGDSQQAECPVCHRSLGLTPYHTGELRFDRAVTALCTQLFPRPGDAERMQAATQREEELRAELRRQQAAADARRGDPTGKRKASRQRAAMAPDVFNGLPSADSATVVFELRNADFNSADAMQLPGVQLRRPFLRSSPAVTDTELAKYVASCMDFPGAVTILSPETGHACVEGTPLSGLLGHDDQPSGVPVVLFRLDSAA
jgi:hypothetical protein